MKKIFIINGKGKAGKDRFIKMVEQISKEKKHNLNFKNVSSIDEIKKIAKEFFDYKGQKDFKWRKILSDLKSVQIESCDGPFNYMIRLFENLDADVIFFHIREPDEIDKMKKYSGAKTVLIRRLDGTDEQSFGNESDDSVFDYKYDIIIFNDTLLKLSYSAELFFEKFILEDKNEGT